MCWGYLYRIWPKHREKEIYISCTHLQRYTATLSAQHSRYIIANTITTVHPASTKSLQRFSLYLNVENQNYVSCINQHQGAALIRQEDYYR